MLKGKKVVIFDFDGTLVNSMEYWVNLDRELIHKLTSTYYDVNFQSLWEEKMKEYENTADPLLTYCNYLAGKYNIKLTGEDILKERKNITLKFYECDILPKDGAAEFIKKLKGEGYILVIATTTSRENIKASLKNKNLSEMLKLFSKIYTYEDAERSKPYPDVHFKIMADFNVKEEECIIFEDNISGVIAANRANIDVIAVYDSQSDIAKAETVKNSLCCINSFTELMCGGVILKYRSSDAKTLLSWFDKKKDFMLWATDRFEKYPITPQDLNEYYEKRNVKAYTFTYMGKQAGHFTMRFLSENTVRFALIAVDKNIRGCGIGQKMLKQAFKLAKEMGAKYASICVFDENENAVNCYKKLGMEYTGKYEMHSLGKYREMKKEL